MITWILMNITIIMYLFPSMFMNITIIMFVFPSMLMIITIIVFHHTITLPELLMVSTILNLDSIWMNTISIISCLRNH